MLIYLLVFTRRLQYIIESIFHVFYMIQKYILNSPKLRSKYLHLYFAISFLTIIQIIIHRLILII